jgi:5,5'-dehydrodivanillate O-demethylase
MVSCNWLQSMENLLDPVHVESLHGRYFADVLEHKGGGQLQEFLTHHAPSPMKKIGFDLFDRGIIERHVTRTEADQSWQIGSPSFFPTTSLAHTSDKNGALIFVVPVDDTHTWFLMQGASRPATPGERVASNTFYDVPGTDPAGNFIRDTANGQDHMVVVTQGEVAQRQSEHLGMSDVGIFLYRKLLMEQLARVDRGEDPINVCRDQKQDRIVEMPQRKQPSGRAGPPSTPRQRKRNRTEGRRTLATLKDPSAWQAPVRGHQEVLIRR